MIKIVSKAGCDWAIRSGTTDEYQLGELSDTGVMARMLSSLVLQHHRAVILDVGAYIGTFTVKMAKNFPEGRVISFEPDEEAFALLQINAQLNNVDAILIRAAVVGANQAAAILHYSGEEWANSTVKDDALDLRDTQEVFAESLGVFLERNRIQVDLAKVNCEGGEADILMETEQRHLRRIEHWIIELHEDLSGVPNSDLRDRIEDCGYELQRYNFGKPGREWIRAWRIDD